MIYCIRFFLRENMHIPKGQTLWEGGAESNGSLKETAGLPKEAHG